MRYSKDHCSSFRVMGGLDLFVDCHAVDMFSCSTACSILLFEDVHLAITDSYS